MFWILMLVRLFCGFVDSALGMGYGVTSATVLLTFGMKPALVSTSVNAAEVIVDGSLAHFHHKLGNVEAGLLPHIIAPRVAAAILGALFLSWYIESNHRDYWQWQISNHSDYYSCAVY